MNRVKFFLYGIIGCELLLISFLLGYLSFQPKEKIELLILNERLPVWETIQRNAAQAYDRENHNCVDFSLDLIAELREMGIASELILGSTENGRDKKIGHAWVGLWVDATTGKLVSINDGYEKNYKINISSFIGSREQSKNEIKNDNNKENQIK